MPSHVSLEEHQLRFVRDEHLNLSSLVRAALNERIESGGVDDLPTGDSRRRTGEKVSTTIVLHSEHQDFIEEHELNLSHFVQDVVSTRMKRERLLDEAMDGQLSDSGEIPDGFLEGVDDR